MQNTFSRWLSTFLITALHVASSIRNSTRDNSHDPTKLHLDSYVLEKNWFRKIRLLVNTKIKGSKTGPCAASLCNKPTKWRSANTKGTSYLFREIHRPGRQWTFECQETRHSSCSFIVFRCFNFWAVGIRKWQTKSQTQNGGNVCWHRNGNFSKIYRNGRRSLLWGCGFHSIFTGYQSFQKNYHSLVVWENLRRESRPSGSGRGPHSRVVRVLLVLRFLFLAVVRCMLNLCNQIDRESVRSATSLLRLMDVVRVCRLCLAVCS